MSHFTVMVIGPDVEKQLEPYNENTEDKDILEFVDKTDELREAWETQTEKGVQIDGQWYSYYDPKFTVYEEQSDKFFGKVNKPKQVFPEGVIPQDVVCKLLNPDFDIFAANDYHKDPETGHYGYWRSPIAKWDWYQVGGRWTGYFKLHKGAKGNLGGPGVFGNKAPKGTADQLYKRDIDIDGMRNDAATHAGEKWDAFHAIVAGREWDSWDTVRGRYDMEKEGDLDKARDEYHGQQVLKDLSNDKTFNFWWEPDKYLESRGDFVQSARLQALAPFAYVYEGVWHERGDMGWWGIVIDEKDPDAWATEFNAFFDSLPDDTMVTVVDCHI